MKVISLKKYIFILLTLHLTWTIVTEWMAAFYLRHFNLRSCYFGLHFIYSWSRTLFIAHNSCILKNNFISGWERHYSGLSDSDLATHSNNSHRMSHRIRHSLSPDKELLADLGDSDMESVVSVTSSAFSTQSERPRSSRNIT